MAYTNIEWTNVPGFSPKTWNPVTGCNKVSPGCKNCYALTMHNRLYEMHRQSPSSATEKYSDLFEVVKCHPATLSQPMTWRKPAAIFVNSMSDLFHVAVPKTFIHEVFKVMKSCPQHIFIILTKRPEHIKAALPDDWGKGYNNVWLGVSIESQTFVHRAETLCSIPAVVRLVSAEPLISSLSLKDYLPRLDWVIIGGESGSLSKCRAMHLSWANDLVQQCQEHEVPVFFKQMGSLAAKELSCTDKKGANTDEMPEKLRIRQFPNLIH